MTDSARAEVLDLLRTVEANAVSAYPAPFRPPAGLVDETILTMHLACEEHLRSIRCLLEEHCTHAGRGLARTLLACSAALGYWASLKENGQLWIDSVLGFVHHGLIRERELNAKALKRGLAGALSRQKTAERQIQDLGRRCREDYGLAGLPRAFDPESSLETILSAIGRLKSEWAYAYLSVAVHSTRLALAVHRRKLLADRVDVSVPDDDQGTAAHFFMQAHRATAGLLDWDTLPLIESFNDTVLAPRIVALARRLGLEEAYQKALEEENRAREGGAPP